MDSTKSAFTSSITEKRPVTGFIIMGFCQKQISHFIAVLMFSNIAMINNIDEWYFILK